MPGRLSHPAIRSRLSGLSGGKLPRIAKRFGYFCAAASAITPEFGSQPGGWISAASTPAASISFRQSSAVQDVIWRCAGLLGRFWCQRWICASTIFISVLPLVDAFALLLCRRGRRECGFRPIQTVMLAQRGSRILRAEQAAPLQQRYHLGAEHLQHVRQE